MEDILNGIAEVVVAPAVLTDVYAGLNTRDTVPAGVDFMKRISGIIGSVIVIITPVLTVNVLSIVYDPMSPVVSVP